MARTIKQIDITEALERARKNEEIYVITGNKKPIIKKFNNLPVGEVMSENVEFIFFVIEEG